MAVDLRDPPFADPAYRQANFHHIQEVVEVFFLLQTARTPTTTARPAACPIGPINSPDDLFEDEHLRARGFFVDVEHDDVPPALYPGAPFRFSRYGAAPLVPRSSPRRAHGRGAGRGASAR